MKQLGDIELARKSLEMRIRAEANIVRLRWLNEVLPAYLMAFDGRLNASKPLALETPSAEEYVAEAIAEALKGVK